LTAGDYLLLGISYIGNAKYYREFFSGEKFRKLDKNIWIIDAGWVGAEKDKQFNCKGKVIIFYLYY
jgi:hypothetical protein